MNDERVWQFESSLWTGDSAHYKACIDGDCVMVLPKPPYVSTGQDAVNAVAQTPRWTTADLSEREVQRPQEGLIVVGYKVNASRDGDSYVAHCTSTYRRVEPEHWVVVQHQQTPAIAV